MKVGIRFGWKESKIPGVCEMDALGYIWQKKLVWIELCKHKFLDSCSSLNVTDDDQLKEDETSVALSMREEEGK